MNNVECIICANIIIVQPQKQFENIEYCSEKCWDDIDFKQKEKGNW